MIEGLVLGLHIVSHHAPAHETLSNTNYGVYARTEGGWTFGALRNSWRRNSFYLGRYVPIGSSGGTEVGALLGAITGYKKKEIEAPCDEVNRLYGLALTGRCFKTEGSSTSHVAPLATLSVSHGGLRLSYVPKYKEKSAVYHLSVEHEF